MKRTTKSGLTITAAPFWLVWLPPQDGGPERFPHLRVTRPQSGNGEPLSEVEALSLWMGRCCNYCTATGEAEDYLIALREVPAINRAACRLQFWQLSIKWPKD